MFKKILCPTDGAEHSAHALSAAADMSAKYGAALTICVVNVAHGGMRGPTISHWTDAEVQKILADAARPARPMSIPRPSAAAKRPRASSAMPRPMVSTTSSWAPATSAACRGSCWGRLPPMLRHARTPR